MTAKRWLVISGFGAIAWIISGIAMNLAFSAGSTPTTSGPPMLFWNVVGLGLFVVWIASGVAILVGLIGALVKALS